LFLFRQPLKETLVISPGKQIEWFSTEPFFPIFIEEVNRVT
jgi:hypothetical protein